MAVIDASAGPRVRLRRARSADADRTWMSAEPQDVLLFGKAVR